MSAKPKKGPREKDLTSRYLSGGLDEDRVDAHQRFSSRNKNQQADKMIRTALLRAEEESGADIDALPIGHVIQVHSLYSEVRSQEQTYLSVMRRTLTKISDAYVVVGDRVRFRAVAEPQGAPGQAPVAHESDEARCDMAEAVIEQVLARDTILTRTDSFKGVEQHPIVANAQRMLIVASIRMPRVKWGLIDRMLAAAQSGKLEPIICLNKMDLVGPDEQAAADVVEADVALAHYESMGVRVLRTSVDHKLGIEQLRGLLVGKETVLAGHSGVGKSTLINAIQADLKLRVGAISGYNDKGRHTTTSARRYALAGGGAVIDTPGVKLFGLWGVTQDNLVDYFPDVAAGSAPSWRQESFERIRESLGPRE